MQIHTLYIKYVHEYSYYVAHTHAYLAHTNRLSHSLSNASNFTFVSCGPPFFFFLCGFVFAFGFVPLYIYCHRLNLWGRPHTADSGLNLGCSLDLCRVKLCVLFGLQQHGNGIHESSEKPIYLLSLVLVAGGVARRSAMEDSD
jgi:hypothetical protein